MKTTLLAAAVATLAACANTTVPPAATPTAPAGDRAMPEPSPAERARPLQDPTPVPPASGWRAVALPAHRASVEDALALAEAAAGSGDDEATREARRLLERAREPLQPGAIDGRWRVRSIQLGGGQGFAYPFFDASITSDASGGASYRFAKTSGSQRRSGRLYPMDGAGLAFLGARTVNDEPPRTYTRVASPGASAPGEHDSAGWLARIGPRELLMVLDADGRGFELYHLRR